MEPGNFTDLVLFCYSIFILEEIYCTEHELETCLYLLHFEG